MTIKTLTAALLLTASASVVASEHNDVDGVHDPLQGYNRLMFSVNDTLDKYALKPVAQGYKFVVPDFAEQGVSNFFDNLGEIGNFVNNALQGKFADAGNDLGRFAINSTIGLFGLLDVASEFGMPEHDEDFGQTLGVWGVGSGPYVVLPLLGPSTVRDTVGLVGDYATDPVTYVDDQGDKNALIITRVIDTRSRLLASEQLISGDKYSFIRDAYLQRREFLIKDGAVTEFDDRDF